MKILFARLFLSLVTLLALTIGALSITPAHAATNPSAISHTAGLSPADWSQINAMLPPNFQEAYLKASNTDSGDRFGNNIAISGDTVVVGADGEDSASTGVNGDDADNSLDTAGAAYVFIRSGTGWSQQAYLKASNTGQNDRFGASVAIDGDTLVVGAPNERSAATGVNGDEANNSLLHAGAAYVFVRSGISWSQQAYLKASNTGQDDGFGDSVSISGNTVAVGALGEDSSSTGVNGNGADNSAYSAGAAYIFNRSDTSWSQQAYLKASNTNAGDLFSISLAIDGDTLVVGAIGESSIATGWMGMKPITQHLMLVRSTFLPEVVQAGVSRLT